MLKNKSKPPVNETTPKTPSLNLISEGTRIKGTITSQNDLRISGRLDGEAICKGKIIVASTARIDGNITTAEADIAGNITGTLKVSDRLTLRKSAIVGGDIYTKVLVVEEGAQMNGNCRMGAEVQELNITDDSEFEKETKKAKSDKD
ncbi:MAG TPA: polymer-forming cytoskeletal protein [Balneolaceae bacterium]|nr:polymer-forming cytoskeletal protein [Balneolaceae bacterium]